MGWNSCVLFVLALQTTPTFLLILSAIQHDFALCLISEGLGGVNYVNFNSNLLYIPGNKVVVALAVTLMTSGPLSMSSG